MVRLNYFLAFLFLLPFILNVSASNINITYLNPSFQNDWGFIEITHFNENLVEQNPAMTIFFHEMEDVSINYIYDFDNSNSLIKKDIESITKFNEEYEILKSKKNVVIDKGIQIVAMSTGGTAVSLIALKVAFPVGVGFILTELVGLSYLVFEILDGTFEYYADYVELVRSTSNNYNSLLYRVEQNNNELIRMGINNPRYRGLSVNDYSQTIYLINSIDYNSLNQREEKIKSSLSNKMVWFSYSDLVRNLNAQYSELINKHDSASYKLLQSYVLQEKIKNNLLEENNLLNSESENLRKKINDKLKYSNENFYNIDEYYILRFSLISSDFSVSPREHVNSASKYYDEAIHEIEAGKKALELKNDNYLVESTIHFDNAISLLVKCDMELSFADVKSQKILSDANSKVVGKYDEAVSQYDSFVARTDSDIENKNLAKKYLEQSKKLIDSEGKTSEKLLNLITANSNIDLALSYLEPSNVLHNNIKENTINSLEYLEKIINLAEKDKVDVSYEKEFLKFSLNEIKDPSISVVEMLEIVNNSIVLSNGIYDKAQVQYSHLNSRFNSLRNVMLLLNTYNPSLKFKEYDYLNSFYGQDGFDKYASLGNYVEISSKFEIFENQINLNKKNIVESMLVFNSLTSSNYYSQIELDVPSRLVITYSTYFNDNSLNYNGPVRFEIPFTYDPYSASEVIKPDDISFSFNNRKLSILINNFTSSRIYSFTLNYDKIFAKTLNVKYSSIPISAEAVQININKEIDNIALSSLKFNKTSLEPSDIYINGEYYGRFNTRNVVINKHLSQGKNNLMESYLFYNPLLYSITEVSRVGEVKRISVNVRNVLPFEIKKQPSIVDLPLTPSSHNIIENTCDVDRSGFRLNTFSQSSKVYFVSDYVPNGQCSFVIELIGEYNKEKIIEDIDSLLNETDNSKAKDLLNKAKGDVNSDKIDSALINIEKAKDLISEDNIKNNERLLLENEYNVTLNELQRLIEDFSKVENKRVSDIVARAERNVNEAEALIDLNRKMIKLVAAQSEIDKLRGIGIDLKLKNIRSLNSIIENWMGFVDEGFMDSVPPELHQELIKVNSIDFTELSSEDFIFLFEIEDKISSYNDEIGNLNREKKDWEKDLSSKYKQLNTQLSNLIKSVENACGNDCPIDMMSIAISNLNLKPSNTQGYSLAIDKMQESISQLSIYLESEKSITLRAFEDAKDFVSKISNEETRRIYLRKLNDIQSKINSGNYLVAKRESLFLMNAIYDDGSLMENNDFLLIVAGLGAILLAFILIKIKSQGTENTIEEYKELKKNNEFEKKEDTED